MRQGAGQAEPDPLSPVSPSPPRRRWGLRRWLALMLMPLGPLGIGAYGWFHPTEALRLGLSLAFGSVVSTAIELEMEYDGVISRSIFPKGARRRWSIVRAIGYGVVCGVAAPVGAWLAH